MGGDTPFDEWYLSVTRLAHSLAKMVESKGTMSLAYVKTTLSRGQA